MPNEFELGPDGSISTPGRFQGERPWVPYFFELGERGEFEIEEDDGAWTFIVGDDEKRLFPELATQAAEGVRLFVEDDGTVRGEVLTADDLEP